MKRFYKSRITFHLLVLLAFVVLALAGCGDKQQSPQVIAQKTLLTAKTTYEATMGSLADLYKQGKISEADRDRAIAIGKKFYDGYMVAVTALEAGNTMSLTKTLQALAELVNFVGQFTAGGK